MQRALVFLFAISIGCGGSSDPLFQGSDATTNDGSSGGDGGPGSDGSSGGDGATDAPGQPDGPAACTGTCAPDWCGCGECKIEQIVCTDTPHPCPLGCVSGCTILSQVKCHCESDRCVHDTPPATVACYTEKDCPPGQCCTAHTGVSAGQCKPNGQCN